MNSRLVLCILVFIFGGLFFGIQAKIFRHHHKHRHPHHYHHHHRNHSSSESKNVSRQINPVTSANLVIRSSPRVDHNHHHQRYNHSSPSNSNVSQQINSVTSSNIITGSSSSFRLDNNRHRHHRHHHHHHHHRRHRPRYLHHHHHRRHHYHPQPSQTSTTAERLIAKRMIANGRQDPPPPLNTYAFMATIIDGNLSLLGSGVIIGERHILTSCLVAQRIRACHCAAYAYLAHERFDTIDEDYVFPIARRSIVCHPDTQVARAQNDIALLPLERAINFTAYPDTMRGYLPLAGQSTNYSSICDMNNCSIVGFGETAAPNHGVSGKNTMSFETIGQQAASVCAANSTFGPIFNQTIHYCLERQFPNVAPCAGDSGGPWACPIRQNSGYYCIMGIAATLDIDRCATLDKPGPTIYTRVDRYVDWIVRKVGKQTAHILPL